MIIVFVSESNNIVSFNPEQVIVEINEFNDVKKRVELKGFYNITTHLVSLGEAARIEERLRELCK